MPIAALIFDLDGTLVDSETAGLDVLYAMASERGAPWSHAQAHQRFRGVPMVQCVADIARHLPAHSPVLDEADFLKNLRTAMAARFREGLTEMPGARQLLHSLQIPFAVATNGPREKAELTLGLTGLRDVLGTHLYCAPEVGSYKPEPQLFLHAAKALGQQAARCAVVEDSLPGMRAGLAAGMRVFSLLTREELPDDMVKQVTCISGLLALQRWL